MFMFRLIGKLLYGDDFDKYSGNQTSQKYIPKDRRLKPSAGNKKKARHIDGPFSLLYVWDKSHQYGSKNDAENYRYEHREKRPPGAPLHTGPGARKSLGHARHLVN